MIVVSDASPINILARIDCIDVLPTLFGSVVLPPAVARELSHERTPNQVRRWISSDVAWLRIQPPTRIDGSLDFNDPGEREAISLALELRADLVLIDDRRARQAAVKRGLTVTGAIGVLEAAAARNLIDLPRVIAMLRTTDFLVAPAILDAAIHRDQMRRARQ